VGQQDPVIRASEVSQYVFCARAWWMGRVKGYRSTNVRAMRQGRARHEAHGRAVEGYHVWRRLAIALMALAVVLLIVWLLSGLGG
jgi:3-mercaptopyruvate sulfurtransferase SseA